MKAAIALLADSKIQNIARRMAFEISQQAEIEFFGSLLPSHVSLKQPFTFERLDRLEAWFDSLALRTSPFDVTLKDLYYAEWENYAIIGFNVVETHRLRELHNQINRELAAIIIDPSAPHDGEEYRFHLTVETGKFGKTNPYKAFYENLEQKEIRLSFRAAHLALFFYADRPIQPGSFILYRVKPLKHIAEAADE
jgi:2'-5' RNA ligase